MDAAVWVCVSDDVVKQLDHACFGNLDGGHGMTAYIRDIMSNIGVELSETCRNTVRLSLDEAFFMHYALKVLDLCKVDSISRQPSQILGTKQIWEYMAQGRPDFPILYICYHHFRSKVSFPSLALFQPREREREYHVVLTYAIMFDSIGMDSADWAAVWGGFCALSEAPCSRTL